MRRRHATLHASVVCLLLLLPSFPAAPPVGTRTVHADLADAGCSDRWSFRVTDVQGKSRAPDAVTVAWTDASSTDVTRDAFRRGNATYRSTLDRDGIDDATAKLPVSWNGTFRLVARPCPPKLVHATHLTEDVHPCTEDRWRFSIDGIDSDRSAPSSIQVGWTHGVEETVPLIHRSGPRARYETDAHLAWKIADATVDLWPDWNGTFRLDKGPCNDPPSATIAVDPAEPTTEDVVTFAANVSDPDGNVTAYDWDLGDGNRSTDRNATYLYPDPGTYEVELTVEDDDGAWNTTTSAIDVDPPNAPATIDHRAGNATTDDPVTVLVNVSDPEGVSGVHLTHRAHLVTGNWTDATNVTVATTGGAYPVDLTVPADADRLAYNPSVVDATGDWTSTGPHMIDVTDDDAPTLDLSVLPDDPAAGENVTFVGELTDNVAAADLSIDVRRDDRTLVDANASTASNRTLTVNVSAVDLDAGFLNVVLVGSDQMGHAARLERTLEIPERVAATADLSDGESVSVDNDVGNVTYHSTNDSRIDVNVTFARDPATVASALNRSTSSDGRAEVALGSLRVEEGPTHDDDGIGSINVTLTFDPDADVDVGRLAVYYWNGSTWVNTRDHVGEAIPGGGPHVLDSGVARAQGVAWAVVDHTSTYALGGPRPTASSEPADPTERSPDPAPEPAPKPPLPSTVEVRARADDGSPRRYAADGIRVAAGGRVRVRLPDAVPGEVVLVDVADAREDARFALTVEETPSLPGFGATACYRWEMADVRDVRLRGAPAARFVAYDTGPGWALTRREDPVRLADVTTCLARDGAAPDLVADLPGPVAEAGSVVTVRAVDGDRVRQLRILVDGRVVASLENGSGPLRVRLSEPGAVGIVVEAVDASGNVARRSSSVVVVEPAARLGASEPTGRSDALVEPATDSTDHSAVASAATVALTAVVLAGAALRLGGRP